MNYPKTYIIAEAGVNHNGSLDLAKKMIDAAVEAGVDAVKFQTFKAEKVVSRYAPKAEYQKQATDKTESQLDMLRKLELDKVAHEELLACCRSRNIQFLSTPFDLESIDLLSKLGLEIFKIPSGEITNLPYLRKIGALKKEIILSTGMSDLCEIEDALDILQAAGTRIDDITVLHCNTEYPSPYNDVNLRAMLTIGNAFGVKVGYSDHTPGIEIAVAAVALGAVVIEKHFTLNRNMPGPDHQASLEPDELQEMVRSVRHIERALGVGVKKASPSELQNRDVARKSIVAAHDIQAGEVFTEDNITGKRPGTGISLMVWDSVIGKSAPRAFKFDEMIEL